MAKKILIVDDEQVNVKMVAYILKANGYDVATAYNGKDGLVIAKKENPDLILLDIMMPGMDGYEVLARIRQDAKFANTPVVMLTAKEKMDDVERAMTLGAKYYIMKPFTSESLLAKVKHALGEQIA